MVGSFLVMYYTFAFSSKELGCSKWVKSHQSDLCGLPGSRFKNEKIILTPSWQEPTPSVLFLN